MSKPFAFLAATSSLALLALPAAAQVEDRHADGAPVTDYYAEEVVQDIGELNDDPRDAGADYAHDGHVIDEEDAGDAAPRAHRHGGHHARHHGPTAVPAAPHTPVLAYTAAERAEWLSQCRALRASEVEPEYYYEEDRDDHDGGLIGGLVGAVTGGLIGNRVSDSHRLRGTLVGAGIGGVAGAVLGTIIDNVDDDDDRRLVAAPAQEPGFDYCEAYLLNYERGHGTPASNAGQMAYVPVMMVPVAQGPMGQDHVGHHTGHRMIVEEHEVEAEEPTPHHTARRTIHHRRAQGEKRTPIN